MQSSSTSAHWDQILFLAGNPKAFCLFAKTAFQLWGVEFIHKNKAENKAVGLVKLPFLWAGQNEDLK